MRFSTIWTIPAMSTRERLRRTGEEITRRVAHRLPRGIAYWSFIDTAVRHIEPDEVVPHVLLMDVLQRAGETR